MIARALDERQRFIAANTRLAAVPYAPEIRLHVADEATELWRKTEDELGEIGLPPPFWAFPWAGGQALARYVLDHPETVRGARILDFAAGSGLVGIAAAKAGARAVEVCDLDPFAGAAPRALRQGHHRVAGERRVAVRHHGHTDTAADSAADSADSAADSADFAADFAADSFSSVGFSNSVNVFTKFIMVVLK